MHLRRHYRVPWTWLLCRYMDGNFPKGPVEWRGLPLKGSSLQLSVRMLTRQIPWLLLPSALSYNSQATRPRPCWKLLSYQTEWPWGQLHWPSPAGHSRLSSRTTFPAWCIFLLLLADSPQLWPSFIRCSYVILGARKFVSAYMTKNSMRGWKNSVDKSHLHPTENLPPQHHERAWTWELFSLPKRKVTWKPPPYCFVPTQSFVTLKYPMTSKIHSWKTPTYNKVSSEIPVGAWKP